MKRGSEPAEYWLRRPRQSIGSKGHRTTHPAKNRRNGMKAYAALEVNLEGQIVLAYTVSVSEIFVRVPDSLRDSNEVDLLRDPDNVAVGNGNLILR